MYAKNVWWSDSPISSNTSINPSPVAPPTPLKIACKLLEEESKESLTLECNLGEMLFALDLVGRDLTQLQLFLFRLVELLASCRSGAITVCADKPAKKYWLASLEQRRRTKSLFGSTTQAIVCRTVHRLWKDKRCLCSTLAVLIW